MKIYEFFRMSGLMTYIIFNGLHQKIKAILKPKKSKFTDSDLKELIISCISAREEYKEIETFNSTQTPFRPEQCTVEGYVKYDSDLREFKKKEREYIKNCKNLRNHLVKMEKRLWDFIPACDIWFVTSDGSFAAKIEKISDPDILFGYELMYTDDPSSLGIYPSNIKRINFGYIFPNITCWSGDTIPPKVYISNL